MRCIIAYYIIEVDEYVAHETILHVYAWADRVQGMAV